MKVDLHNHLRTFSTMKNFNKVIDAASKNLGEEGVFAVVGFEDGRSRDFVSLPGYERVLLANSAYVPEKKVYVVNGQEIPTKQGHLLVIGTNFSTRLKSGRSVEDTIKEAHDEGAIVIADHPFGIAGVGDYLVKNRHLLRSFDGIETHNGESGFWIPGVVPRGANEKATSFYLDVRNDFPYLGSVISSDGHSLHEIGSSSFEILHLNFVDETSFRESLRFGINHHRDPLDGRRTNSFFGTVNHTALMAAYILFNKFGVNIDPYHKRK